MFSINNSRGSKTIWMLQKCSKRNSLTSSILHKSSNVNPLMIPKVSKVTTTNQVNYLPNQICYQTWRTELPKSPTFTKINTPKNKQNLILR